MADEDSEKTEEPTPERQKKARDDGQFPRSRDVGPLAGSFLVLLSLFLFGRDLAGVLRNFAVHCFTHLKELEGNDPRQTGYRVGFAIVVLALPLALLAAIGAIGGGVVQAGFNPKMELAAPKWNRLDPISKLKQMVQPQGAATQTGLSLGRLLVVGLVTWAIIRPAFPKLVRLGSAEITASVLTIVEVLTQVALWATLALALLAALDFAYNYWKHFQQIKMTKQEVKEEFKQQEGDQQLKGRMRQRAREIAKRGIIKEVKRSDVVVANPTHIAVAIRYRAEEGIPIVMAKGYDEVAQFIKQLARDNDIPVIENKPLARALAAAVKAGKPVPVDLYAAVAEVLAFIFRLRGRGMRA